MHRLCMDLFDLRDRLFADKTPSMRLFQEHIQELLNPLPPAKPESSRAINTYRSEPYLANWKCINTHSPHGHASKAETHQPSEIAEDARGTEEVSPTVPFEIPELCSEGKKIVPPATGAVPGFAFNPLPSLAAIVPSGSNANHAASSSAIQPNPDFPVCSTTRSSKLTEAEGSPCVLNDAPIVDSWVEPPVPLASSPSDLENARDQESTELVPVPGYPVFDIAHTEHATECPPVIPWWVERSRTGIDPMDLDEHGVLLVRLASFNVQFLKFAEGQAVESVIRAEGLLGSADAHAMLFDALGFHVHTDMMLRNQMILVLSPIPLRPADIRQLPALQHLLATVPRSIGIFYQGPFVAYDELSFYLTALASTMTVEFVSPLMLGHRDTQQALGEAWMYEILALVQTNQQVISVICTNHHWVPIAFTHERGSWTISAPRLGHDIWQAIEQMLDSPIPEFERFRKTAVEMPLTFEHNCGFQTVWWFHGVLSRSLRIVEVTPDMANDMRFNFTVACMGHTRPPPTAVDLCLGGAVSQELQNAVGSILQEHGVPASEIHTRSTKVIDTLGAKQLDQIFRTPRPWVALKQAANQVSPPLQLVLAHELQSVLAARAKDNKPVGNKKRKQPKETFEPPASIPPLTSAEVIIPEGVFRQDDGFALPQIRASDIAPNMRGIVVGTEKELQAYMSKPCLSSEGLGLIVLEPSSQLVSEHGPTLRFPISYALTQEPMLISAILLQKGKKRVERNLPEQRVQVKEQDNQVFKMILFRDEVPDWTSVVKAPVRFVLDLLPGLQICRESNCKCARRHEVDGNDPEEALLDVWNRDFLSIKFARVSPPQADMYACTIRVAAAYTSQVFKASGTSGLYAEPRAINGAKATTYHTVWLPKKTLEEVRAEQSAMPVSTFIVRLNQKYGLCSDLEKAEEVHRTLKGSQPFLAGPVKQVWHLGPLPWGSTRRSVSQLIEAWSWVGKPLQPVGRAADGSGLMWSVQSGGPPPHTVYSLAHGDIVVTRADKPVLAPSTLTVRAEVSKATRESIGRSEVRDPLQAHDPWAKAVEHRNRVGQDAAVAVTHAHLATLEASLSAKIAQATQQPAAGDVAMETQWEQRVSTLENQVQQLTVAHQAHSQQTSIMSAQVAQLAAKMDQQSHVIEQQLDTKMAEQMQKIESCCAKGPEGSDSQGKALSRAGASPIPPNGLSPNSPFGR